MAFQHLKCHAWLKNKQDLHTHSKVEAIVDKREREKARRRIWGTLCSYGLNKNWTKVCESLSGPILKKKVSDLVLNISGTEFTPKDGWLSCWKARHNLVFEERAKRKASASKKQNRLQ